MAEIKPLKLGGTGAEQFGSTDSVAVANGGVPAGGGSDEVLIKASGSDFDVSWGPIPTQNKLSFDVEPPVNGTGQGNFTPGLNAGASVTAFECVYLGSAGTWLLTDASAEATSSGMLALSMETKTSSQAMNVALPGSIIRNDTWAWATVGAKLYLSLTAGAITDDISAYTTGDVVRIVGYVLTDDCIYFNPSTDYITLA